MTFYSAEHWFGQFHELCFVLNWLIIEDARFGPNLRRQKRSRQHDPKSAKVKSVDFNHLSQGNPTNYYIILDPRDKAAPPTSQQHIGQFLPKRVKY